MAVPYRNMDEITDRMHNSVCLLDGEPVYVAGGIDKIKDVLAPGYYRLPYMFPRDGAHDPRRIQHLPVTDPKWSVRDFNLGYYNAETGLGDRTATYLSRIPIRGAGYKAGLTENNIEGLDRAIGFFKALGQASFKDMLQNKYPSYNVALKLVRRSEDRVAFDKQLAIGRTELDAFTLFYRGRKIATSLDGNEYKLGKQHAYLKELLEEKRIRILA